MDSRDFDQVEGAIEVVGHAKLCRSDGEGGVLGRDDEITAEDELAGSAPDRSFDHRDYGQGDCLDFADQLAEGVVVSQRVAAVGRQLLDVMTGGKDPDAFGSAQNYDANIQALQIVESGRDVVQQAGAERIDAAMIHGDGGDAAGDCGNDAQDGVSRIRVDGSS